MTELKEFEVDQADEHLKLLQETVSDLERMKDNLDAGLAAATDENDLVKVWEKFDAHFAEHTKLFERMMASHTKQIEADRILYAELEKKWDAANSSP